MVIVAKCCKFKVPEPVKNPKFYDLHFRKVILIICKLKVRYADIQSREKIKKMTYE